jgi:hypothetical protein
MRDTERSERDTMDVGQPEEAQLADEVLGQGKPAPVDKPDEERADEVLGQGKPAPVDKPDEDRAEEELEPLEGGAEAMADLDEEAGQPNRPGTERPPV